MKIDKIYKKPLKSNQKFKFDEMTVSVFENMLNRSVPNYQFVTQMTGAISQGFIKNGTNYYDLGCSLGATTYSVLKNNLDKNFSVVAIDNSQAMIEKAQVNFNFKNIDFIVADICDFKYENASFVSMNFTLQFIEPSSRKALLKKIYDAMLPNSCLILSEKIKFQDQEEDVFMEDLQGLFKKVNGYSDLEIAQKRTALEDVLVRETFEEYEMQLKNIGFTKVYKWFQSFNFVSICVVKS